jgi:hypothetical protein
LLKLEERYILKAKKIFILFSNSKKEEIERKQENRKSSSSSNKIRRTRAKKTFSADFSNTRQNKDNLKTL